MWSSLGKPMWRRALMKPCPITALDGPSISFITAPVGNGKDEFNPIHACNNSRCGEFRNRTFTDHKQKSRQFNPQPKTSSRTVAARWKNVSEPREAISQILNQVATLERNVTSASKNADGKPDGVDLPLVLFHQTRNIFNALEGTVDDGRLLPSGKHGKELSSLLEQILLVYRRLPMQEHGEISIFRECQRVLDVLEKWYLNCRNPHYEMSIACAFRERLWDEAARLFWKLIDPEAGRNPVRIPVDEPLGLLAIARSAQKHGMPAGEQVMDAVQRMSMTSPSDQAAYVLAAGVALGRVGEWEYAIQYIQSSPVAVQLKEPLVASVMHACLLCDRPRTALKIYDDYIGGEKCQLADEWQWGGRSDRMDPLCRDLAMQAMATTSGRSDAAWDCFRQALEDNVTITLEAIQGVVGACECDGQWESAFWVVLDVLERSNHADWIVPRSDLAIIDRDLYESSVRAPSASVAIKWLPKMGNVLASAMRACNSSSKYGVSLLLFRLVDLTLPSAVGKQHESVHNGTRNARRDPRLEQSLLPLLLRMSPTEQILAATVNALCRLGCAKAAEHLFELIPAGGDRSSVSDSRSQVALNVTARREEKLVGNTWETAARHMFRLSAALQSIQSSHSQIFLKDMYLLEGALAAAMRACTASYQPETSLYLAAWARRALDMDRVSSDGVNGLNKRDFDVKNPIKFVAFRTDALIAETILALRWSHRDLDALDLFDYVLANHRDNMSQWRLTAVAGLKVLLSVGKFDDALATFLLLGASGCNADTYSFMARGLLRERRWQEIHEVYSEARRNGCLSEDLAVVAMRAVIYAREDDKFRKIRGIVDDIAVWSGVESQSYLREAYWRLKQSLGFPQVRVLLRWYDLDTCHLDELSLAINEFESTSTSCQRPSREVVQVIVANAMSFKEGSIPEYRRDLVWLPRNSREWIELLLQVWHEIQQSEMVQDPDFVGDLHKALRNFNCSIKLSSNSAN